MSNSTYFGGVLHGGEKENKLKLSGNEVLYLSEISAISDTKFNSVKVIVLTSCYSGRRGGFVDTLLKKGVDVVIGFSGEVEQKTSVYWTTRFIYTLTQGNTVADAISSANSELDKKDGEPSQLIERPVLSCLAGQARFGVQYQNGDVFYIRRGLGEL